MSSKPALQPEKPRKRVSRELPPDLSDLISQLTAAAVSFIQMFDSKENWMRDIVVQFCIIAEEVKTMQENTDKTRTFGALSVGVGLILAPFTAGASLGLVGAAAAGGGAAIVAANAQKITKEKEKAEEVKKLGDEFIKLTKPLNEMLNKIKMLCEALEETAPKVQAENAQREMETFQEILRRVIKLKEKCSGVLIESVTLLGRIRDMLLFFFSYIRVTASPEEDQKLRDSIIQSADQTRKVYEAFIEMKMELRVFRGE